MKRNVYAAIAALVLLFVVQPAGAAPKAESGEECFYATDMLLTARALVETGVPERKVREAIARMYAPQRVAKWAEDIVRHALAAQASAKDAARAFLEHCAAKEGNVDALLGVRL